MEAFRAVGIRAPNINPVTFSVHLRVNLLAAGPYMTVWLCSMMRLYGSRSPIKALPIKLPEREWPVSLVTLKDRTFEPGSADIHRARARSSKSPRHNVLNCP